MGDKTGRGNNPSGSDPSGSEQPAPQNAAGEPVASSSGACLDVANLVRDHHAELYRYAFRLTGRAPDAEDLVQQTFLIAQQRLQQLRAADRVRPWLYTVLRSCFLKDCRKRVPLSASAIELDVESFTGPEPEASDIDVQQLQAALDSLPDEARVMVTMFYYEDASYKEIAKQMNLKLGTVMSRLARAKEKLRQRLFQSTSARR